MKFRNGFVTNSSSSSFIVSIKIETVDGREISFYGNGGTPESGRIDYFECDAGITASPKKMGRAKDVEELIAILTEGVIDCNEWCDEDQHVKIFEKSNPVECEVWDGDGECKSATFDAYDFVKEIREKVKSMDDDEYIVKALTIGAKGYILKQDFEGIGHRVINSPTVNGVYNKREYTGDICNHYQKQKLKILIQCHDNIFIT